MSPASGTSASASASGRETERSASRRVRTPVFPQQEATECGAACLGSVLAHFGRWATVEDLRETCGVNRDGSTALDIARAAEGYGLEVEAWKREPYQLKRAALPAVLFWEFNHFVVLEGFSRRGFHINDPANGRLVVDEARFDRAFTGVMLAMRPGPGFEPGGVRPGIARRVWPWLREVRSPLGFVAACGLLLALPGLLMPILLTLFVDFVLAGAQTRWGLPLAAAAAAAAATTYAVIWLQQKNLRRMAVRLSAVRGEQMLSRLFRLPSQFFMQRFAGDLMTRVQLIDEVAAAVSKNFTGLIIEMVVSCLFLVLMIVYDAGLAVLVLGLAAISLVVTKMASRLRNDENRQVRRERALLAGIGAAGMRNIESIRATATEDDFFTRWSGYQARELSARQRFAELGNLTSALPSVVLLLGAAAIFGVGGLKVASGDMTVGALMGFYVVMGSFLRPVGRFVHAADAFEVLESNLQRIDDVASSKQDPAFVASSDEAPGRVATVNGRLRLDGRIELRNVTFGYRRNHPPLIEGFSLTVEPGQRVAVIGPTGSGKSTLLKLVSGEYTPWEGEVLLDGVPITEVPRQVLTSSVSIVDQHIFLFSGTIRDNLTMWNPGIEDHRVVAAASDALIHDDIVARPGGYDALVQEGGLNFSHGQRQRLEIARAMVPNPSVMLLDEATSRLDAITEVGIDDALRRRGCSCLMIAHRLSTIRDCDQIVILERGREVQRGIHQDLLADRNGLYYQLLEAE